MDEVGTRLVELAVDLVVESVVGVAVAVVVGRCNLAVVVGLVGLVVDMLVDPKEVVGRLA